MNQHQQETSVYENENNGTRTKTNINGVFMDSLPQLIGFVSY